MKDSFDPMTSGAARGRCDDGAFLTGPDGRLTELRRAVGIVGELVRGFRALHFAGPCVTVSGSGRFGEDHPYYQLAREIGAGMARAGLTVMSCGGAGVMEAASRGAREAGGRTVGCTIDLPGAGPTNPYVDRELRLRHFFVRKAMLVKYSVAFVALPGGFGTMDDVFQTLTLAETGSIRDFPLVLAGEGYWRPLLDQIGTTMIRAAVIDRSDLRPILITNSAEEATRYVLRCAEHRFGIKLVPPRARRFLGEHALRGRAERAGRPRHGLLGRRRARAVGV